MARESGKYGKASVPFRKEILAFSRCHGRVSEGKVCSIAFPRTYRGFLLWLAEIGEMPADMQKPSVGRIDHSKGYEPGNIQWEEHHFNSVKRRGTKHEKATDKVVQLRQYKFRKGTPEHLEHQRQATLKRWSDPAQKEAMSQRMIGNKYQSGIKKEK